MSRIKLPGKEKNKKIILIVLVIVAIIILSYEAWTNITSKNIKNENKVQKEMVKPMDTEESYIDNTANTDAEEAGNDNSKTNNNDEKIKINEKEKNYSARENELYNDAYRLFFSHEYVNAISKADALIREFPSNVMGYNIRGIAKAYNGDYDGGMKDIDTSLNIDKNYGYARFNKALTYELYENMDQALEWYNKALEVEDYVWSYYGIASIYGRRGDVVNTMTYLNKAIQIDSGVKEEAKTEHDFDSVNNSKEFQKAVYN
ncbi:MAG: hypothetical protein LLF98_07600 [Clostridium sp.]|uniref:tetratricopeptide repeat protein n=1 Tax=Clostridium sp. TaxID=1506 RepID=UPI0025C6D506|nr:hypothetical protein [Clostridium sp.]MCE5221118.1 hypothetical protein [Clostridium sp.]